MVFGLLASAVTSLAAFAFPTFASYKAIKANDDSQMVPWLMFWSVQACVSFLEHWLYFILQWVPLYKEAKMILTLWMVLPQTQGANYLYLHYIHPNLARYEHDLDGLIISLHEQIRSRGGQYLEVLISKVLHILYGSTEHLTTTYRDVNAQDKLTSHNPSGSGYIASLFSRFRTVPVGSAPETIPSSLMSFLSQSRHGGDIIPANLTGEERSKFVNRQKAKLQEWLHMLEAAERSYPPINITSSPSSPSEATRRNARQPSNMPSRSASGVHTPENTFSDYEDLGTDDIIRKGSNTSSPQTSGGWFWKGRTD